MRVSVENVGWKEPPWMEVPGSVQKHLTGGGSWWCKGIHGPSFRLTGLLFLWYCLGAKDENVIQPTLAGAGGVAGSG